MAKFAILNEDKVINVILADTITTAKELTGADCVEVYDDAVVYINGLYDKETNTFLPPVIEEIIEGEEVFPTLEITNE
jgi:hypothetical protein